MSRFKLVAAAVTDVGRVRDGNEDDFLDQADRLGLVAVADGMGGHRAGEVASATALEALRAAVASGNSLRNAIEGANEAVLEKSESDRELHGIAEQLARTYLLHHRLFELFGVRTIPRARDLVRAIASSARLHLRCERTARAAGQGAAGVWRALGLAVAWPLGQYLGGRSASKGHKPMRWRAV